MIKQIAKLNEALNDPRLAGVSPNNRGPQHVAAIAAKDAIEAVAAEVNKANEQIATLENVVVSLRATLETNASLIVSLQSSVNALQAHQVPQTATA